MNKPIEILITHAFDAHLVDELQQALPDVNIQLYPAKHSTDVPEEAWQSAEVLYTYRALPDPGQAPKLSWIQYHLAGIEKLLESPLIHQQNIAIATMSGANASQVAEHGIAMLLALCRRLPELVAYQSRGEWMDDKEDRYQPLELYDSTVGIVGYGSVGRRIAKLLKAFDATILAVKRDVMDLSHQGYSPFENYGDPNGDLFTRLYPVEALCSMLKECDYVFITVPLTEKTRGLIGAPQLEALKPDAILVDISRGGVVEEKALVKALEEGKLAGAAIDVFSEEPLPTDSPFWELDNVLISPHVAGFSKRYDQNAMHLFIENIHRFIKNQPLLNQYDPERGY